MTDALYRRGEQTGGESYFVSLNDLLVGMLFVFIILLMAFALSYQSAETAMKAELTQRTSDRTTLLSRLKQALDEAGIPVELDIKNGVLRLPENALFASGSADLNAEGMKAVGVLSSTLDQLLPCYSGTASTPRGSGCPRGAEPVLEAVYVEGHTDNVRINTAKYPSNWELSSARAINTYNALLNADPKGTLRTVRNASGTTLFGVSAYADQRPVISNDTEEGRRKNRRIDLRFLLAPWDKPSAIRASVLNSK